MPMRTSSNLDSYVKRAGALLLCMCLGMGISTGGVLAAGITVIDDTGTTVTLAKPPQRVVTLLPSLTETVCDLDACARLVGTDRWSNWPASVRALPKLGGLDDPHIEMIVAQKPDLVLVAPASRLATRLRGLGLTVAELYATDVPSTQHVMQQVAKLLGQPEKAAIRWQALQTNIQLAKRLMPAKAQGVSVYFEVSATPFAAGEASFIGQLLTQLGARNVVPASMGPFPQINPEFVVRAKPSVIIISSKEAPQLLQRPGWASLPAVRQGMVCPLNALQMDVLSRPGPRMGEAAMVLAKCLRQVTERGAAP
jgi:iron complex transport system substrate-binding protein